MWFSEIYENVSRSEAPEEQKGKLLKINLNVHAIYSGGSYQCQESDCLLGRFRDFSVIWLLGGVFGFMFTSLVEYSLIGAAVMYIVWRNIKHEDDHAPLREKTEILRVNLKNISVGKLLGKNF